MNIFEFALKMEMDGERYYRKQAAKTKYEDLQVVLAGLADDEHRHYITVLSIQDQTFVYNAATSIDKMKNVFELAENRELIPRNKESIAKMKNEQLDVYQAGLLMEEESIRFYKLLKDNVEQQAAKDIIDRLIHEEEYHAEVLENIVEMFNHVNEWVESAEFNHQSPY